MFIHMLRRTPCALSKQAYPNLATLSLGGLHFGRVSPGAIVPECHLATSTLTTTANTTKKIYDSSCCDRKCTGGGANKLLFRWISGSPSSGSEKVPHFKRSSVEHPLAGRIASIPATEKEGGDSYTLPHPIWSKEEVEAVEITHTPPKDKVDKAAYLSVQLLRVIFDVFSGYKWGKMVGTLDEKKWLTRIIFLETVAAVPGMIGAMTRHLKSLRLMQRDHGWIHTLLEEAENERMHLLTALELRRPGPLFKAAVVLSQGVFVTCFWMVYPFSSRFCHRFVGYLEEEAVKTYTLCLECMDEGKLPMWERMPAPPLAINYWRLQEDAMMRDVLLAIRADEAHHRVVNHTLSSMNQSATNPHRPGE